MNITEQREIFAANIQTFMHGDDAAAIAAAVTISSTVESEETYIELITRYLVVAANALRVLAPFEVKPGDPDAYFALSPSAEDPDPTPSRSTALQLINTFVNGDTDTCSELLAVAMATNDPSKLGDLVVDVAQYAKSLHLRICGGDTE